MNLAKIVPLITLMAMVMMLGACSSGFAHDSATTESSAAVEVIRAPALPLPPRPVPIRDAVAIGPSNVGLASWYRRGPRLKQTCAGTPLVDDELLAASPTLDVGTRARVTLLGADRSIIVRVDDCMPPGHRIIDLSVAAARKLGMLQRGIARVRVTPIAW